MTSLAWIIPVLVIGVSASALVLNASALTKSELVAAPVAETTVDEEAVEEPANITPQVPISESQTNPAPEPSQEEVNEERFKTEVEAAFPWPNENSYMTWRFLDEHVRESVGDYSDYDAVLGAPLVKLYFEGHQKEDGTVKVYWNAGGMQYYTVPN